MFSRKSKKTHGCQDFLKVKFQVHTGFSRPKIRFIPGTFPQGLKTNELVCNRKSGIQAKRQWENNEENK